MKPLAPPPVPEQINPSRAMPWGSNSVALGPFRTSVLAGSARRTRHLIRLPRLPSLRVTRPSWGRAARPRRLSCRD